MPQGARAGRSSSSSRKKGFLLFPRFMQFKDEISQNVKLTGNQESGRKQTGQGLEGTKSQRLQE